MRPKRLSSRSRASIPASVPASTPTLRQGYNQGNIDAAARRLRERLYKCVDVVLRCAGVANIGNQLIDQNDARSDMAKESVELPAARRGFLDVRLRQ